MQNSQGAAQVICKKSYRRVQTWHKGANLAKGCKPGRTVQKVRKVGIPPAPLHLLHPLHPTC